MHTQKRAFHTRALGWFSAALIAMTGSLTLVAPAHAEEPAGNITDFELAIIDDGTSEVPGDTSPTDGLVALGNQVTFDWALTLNSLENGVLTQELPEGWSWDDGSLMVSGLNNPSGLRGYTSTYTISPDGRLLTVNLSSAVTGSGSQEIEFRPLTANVNRASAVVGYEYAPTASVTDGVETRTFAATGDPQTVTVVGFYSFDLSQTTRTATGGVETAAGDEKDFGQGPEPAVAHTYRVVITQAKPTVIGTRPAEWAAPLRIRDTYSFTNDETQPAHIPSVIEIVGTSSSAVQASLDKIDTEAGVFDLLVSGNIEAIERVWVDVSILIPKRLTPMEPATAIPSASKISQTDDDPWTTVGGDIVIENNDNNNRATASYRLADPDTRPPTIQSASLTTALVDGKSITQTRNNAKVFPGYEYHHRLAYRPQLQRPYGETAWQSVTSTDMNFF
ncbi:hypothetical protein [Leucobacter chinensis]|uniref:hypothetical protein n=1 Tax=Leucobacter chinensis TaxID=2851010 RepID=UPI001C23C237|nr:hypothetical protein [Leucobacter chinensis]